MARNYRNVSIPIESDEMLQRIVEYRQSLKPIRATKRDLLYELIEKEYKKLPKEAK